MKGQHRSSPLAVPAADTNWHSQSAEAVLAALKSTPTGLSSKDASTRLTVDGPNELKEQEPTNPWGILFSQFKSFFIWLLIAAGVISGLMGQWVDASAILAIVCINVGIGFYQEFRAEKSISALRKIAAPRANVRRDGEIAQIDAKEIVAGDILLLEAGDLVAADARLLRADSLKCVEAALTGEAASVSKHSEHLKHNDVPLADRKNMVFMGTSVAAGTGHAVVVATAMNTQLGQIAGLIVEANADEKTPLQQKLNSFGRLLVWATFGIIALLFALGLLRGMKPLELLLTAISLAVAAVPEGLPAVVTVALALGVRRLARRRALIRKLPAVETLGSTTVICTDKTGTLTIGQMTVRVLYVAGQQYEVTGEGYGPKGTIQLAGKDIEAQHQAPLTELASIILACNSAHLVEEKGEWKVIGDPTEGALLTAGAKAGADLQRIQKDWPKQGEIPFDSDRKRSSMIRRMPEGAFRLFSNGAPGQLLKACTHLYTETGVRPLTESDRTHILAQTSAMAKQALRVLASAYRDLGEAVPTAFTAESMEQGLVFVGLCGMYDPPRPEAKIAVADCHAAGIRVVMITGDHHETAAAIARELGIATGPIHTVTGLDLDKLPEDALRQRVSQISVYARVTAAHKLRIVRALKANNDVVAMTGDGVNDAPAIKGADIGIAMGMSGSEVTKQAADMIITNDNFATIVAAVEEGRGVYDNIRQTLQYLLAGSAGELLLMTVCVIVGLPMPLLPIHLLWINLVTDGLPALCLATDPIDTDVMKRPPRPKSEHMANGRFFRTLLFTGSLTAGIAFAVYYYTLKTSSLATAQTSAFAVLVFSELFRAFGARSEIKPLWKIRPLLNINLVIVVIVSVGLQIGSQQSALFGRILKTSHLPLIDCLGFLELGLIPLLVLELVKVVRNSRGRDLPHGSPSAHHGKLRTGTSDTHDGATNIATGSDRH